MTPIRRTTLVAAALAVWLGGCGGGGAGEAEPSRPAAGADPHVHGAPAGASAQAMAVVGALAGATPGTRAVKPSAAPVSPSGRSGTVPRGLASPTRPTAYVSECLVDFSDRDALEATRWTLWFDRLYVPWFQRCGAGGSVDLRPMVEQHVHLGFEAPDVVPCFSDPQAYPSRDDGQGGCNRVDIATEPRTAVMTHGPWEFLQLRAMTYDSPLPDYQPLAFDLQRVRVLGGVAVRLCYRKQQAIEGDWVAAPGGTTDAPGVWLCWNHLAPGHWDLSDWATDLSEVRITAADGEGGPYSVGDLKIGLR